MINLSETASNAMLDVLAGLMDGGSIELLTGDGKVLAMLKLSSPAAETAVDGEIELDEIRPDAALAQGNAMAARILAADGSEIFSCDVGDEDSEAVVKLNTTRIYRGGPIQLSSFRLAMP